MNNIKAFTLVEVLISIFILSIISVAALSSFQQMIKAKEIQKNHEAVLTSLSFAYTTLSNDISQKMDDDTPLIFTEKNILFERVIEFGDDAFSHSANIEYFWENEKLLRHVYHNDEKSVQILLKVADNIQWEWLSQDTWYDISVPSKAEEEIRALKLSFTDPTIGDVVWVFSFP